MHANVPVLTRMHVKQLTAYASLGFVTLPLRLRHREGLITRGSASQMAESAARRFFIKGTRWRGSVGLDSNPARSR
jgi:hypothetical protein